MRFLASFLFTSLVATQVFAADIRTFCDGIPQNNFTDVLYVADNRTKIQEDLHQRDNQTQIEGLLVTYNELNAKLLNVTSESLDKVMAIAGFCYMKLPESIAEGYKAEACPNIKPTKVRDLVNLALTAKAIVSFSSGPETPEIKRISSSKLTAEFIDTIETLFSVCGQHLGVDDPIEEEPIEEEEEEDPGVCLASPYDKLTEFLWKPVSESDGRLVILTNPTTSLVVNGETLSDKGASNGRCSTSRASKSGCGFGKDALVAVTTLSEFRIIQVPDGCKRYECKNSLSSCGLKSWDTQELIKLKKKQKKLQVKIRNATNKKQIKKLRKTFQENKAILKYAKEFGA